MSIRFTDFSPDTTGGDFEKARTVEQLREKIVSTIKKQIVGFKVKKFDYEPGETEQTVKKLWAKQSKDGWYCPVKYSQYRIALQGPGKPDAPNNLDLSKVVPWYEFMIEQIRAGDLDAEIIETYNSWMEDTHHSDLCLPLPLSDAA